jgi:uncharacterized protein (DUF433 family)
MTSPLNVESVSLRMDESGTVRIGNSRITLDLVVEQYQSGMTPEDMVRAYDTLELPDVYGAIAYYLRHHEEVDAYLRQREAEATALQAEIEKDRPRISKDELISRRNAMGAAHAATGQ